MKIQENTARSERVPVVSVGVLVRVTDVAADVTVDVVTAKMVLRDRGRDDVPFINWS